MAACVLIALTSINTQATPLKPWTGASQPPPFTLQAIDGTEVSLGAFRGRTIIVNFWATWCVPCVAEMPSLQRARDRLANDGVEVIAINLQESRSRVARFVDRLGLTFPVVLDPSGATKTAWGVRVFPTTFVIAPDQRITFVARGEVDWDDAEVQAQVRGTKPKGPRIERTVFIPR